jgi:hypothetical protein
MSNYNWLYSPTLFSRTNGTTFQTSRVDNEVKNLIKINNVISYKFKHTLPNGIPIEPIIYRIRRDITWKDALNNRSKILPNPGTPI